MTTDPRLHALTTTLLHEMSVAHQSDIAALELLESNLQGLLDALDEDHTRARNDIKQTRDDAIVAAQHTYDSHVQFAHSRAQTLTIHVSAILDKVRLSLQKAKAPVNDDTPSQSSLLEGPSNVHRLENKGNPQSQPQPASKGES